MMRRYRRRIVTGGAVVCLVVLVFGSVLTVNRVQNDLERRVDAALAAEGAVGVSASFSGQDGTLRCDAPLAATGPSGDELIALAEALRGVRSVDLDASCGTGDDATADDADDPDDAVDTDASATTPVTEAPVATATPTTEAPATTLAADEPALATTVETLRNDSQFTVLAGLIDDAGLADTLATQSPLTLFAPTNDAFEALGPDTIAALGRDPELLADVLRHHAIGENISADQLTDGNIVMLDGTAVTVDAAGPIVASGDVTAAITQADIATSNGVTHAIDAVLLPPGFALPDSAPSTTTAPTTTTPTSTTPTSTEAPVADDAAAAELTAELNEFVAANPILFAVGSADIAAASQPVIDTIAERAGSLSGITIEVQGHTDTDGDPERNQALSEARADAVRDALVSAGLPTDSVTAVGFGGTQTIVGDDGVEDKDASRRVEFLVTST